MNREFYVYLYWRLDTNEVFYVGKGKGDRWKALYSRNNYFKNIANKHLIVCEIVKNDLTEGEAFYWEEEIIRILVFEYGYSIDILNNHSKEKGNHLVNKTWGGEGVSRTWNAKERKRKSELFKGENNPNYGKHISEEQKKKISEINSGKNSSVAKPVICLTTKRIFYTATEGVVYYNCDSGNITRCCKGERNYCGKLPDGTKLAWMYLEDFLNKCKYILL